MKQTISFQLDKSLVEQLKAEADAKYLSISALLRIILLQHLKGDSSNE